MTASSISSVNARKPQFLLVVATFILLLGLLWFSQTRHKGENYVSLRAKAEA